MSISQNIAWLLITIWRLTLCCGNLLGLCLTELVFFNISSKRLCVQLQLHFKWGIFKTWNDSPQEDSHIVTTAWSDHLWRIFVNLCVHWIGIPQNFACLLAYIGMTKELFPFLYFIKMILRKTTAFLNCNFQNVCLLSNTYIKITNHYGSLIVQFCKKLFLILTKNKKERKWKLDGEK